MVAASFMRSIPSPVPKETTYTFLEFRPIRSPQGRVDACEHQISARDHLLCAVARTRIVLAERLSVIHHQRTNACLNDIWRGPPQFTAPM